MQDISPQKQHCMHMYSSHHVEGVMKMTAPFSCEQLVLHLISRFLAFGHAQSRL